MHKDWFIGHQRISPSKSEQQQMSGSSSADPGPGMTINFTRMLHAENPKPERRPVPIRPPSSSSSKTPVPRRRDAPIGVSCEPTLKPIIRRSHSLPPSSQKKAQCKHVGVRFVDSLGLDLEDVRLFEKGDDPSVPPHVTFRLLMGAELADGKRLEISLPYLKPAFAQQPGDDPRFLHRLEEQKVCLERVLCFDLGVVGVAQVVNLDFEKEVVARYSFTEWKSSTETRATWVSSVTKTPEDAGRRLSCDTFRFRLPVPPFLQPGAVLEFAIRYKVRGGEHWDNNNGKNYKLVCENYKLPVPRECEDSMVHFI